MAIYFSASTCAFYNTDVINVGNLPDDAVAITDSEYDALMQHQAAGCVIESDENGAPTYREQTCGSCTRLSHESVVATSIALGHVKAGANIDVTVDGTISTGSKESFTSASGEWSYSLARYTHDLTTKRPIIGVYEATDRGFSLVSNVDVLVAENGTQSIKSLGRFSGYVLTL